MITPYADANFADTYFGERLHSEAWFTKSPANRETARLMATRAIDLLDYVDSKVSTSQTEEFPRGTQTAIPEDIKIACCEIAFARLVDLVDPDMEYANARVLVQRYATVSTTYVPDTPFAHVMAGIASPTAWRYLVPYLKDERCFKLSRVN